MSAAVTQLLATRQLGRRASTFLFVHPKLFLVLLLVPPLLWLGVVYIGSMFALLIQSFFSIDEFTGLIQRTLTLNT